MGEGHFSRLARRALRCAEPKATCIDHCQSIHTINWSAEGGYERQEGDFYPTARPVAPCPAEIAQIKAAGGDISYAHLPDLTPGSLYPGSPGAITGNEHMVMLDNNNQQIAQIIHDWLRSRGL